MTESTITLNEKHINAIKQPKSTILMFGGSSSGKTYTVSQWLLLQLLGDDPFFGIYCRKHMSTLIRTAWREFLQMADLWGVLPYLKINQVYHTIWYRKNTLQFMQLDSEDKIKGFECDAIFIDELNDIKEDVFFQVLNRGGRSKDRKRKIICASNPVSPTHWIIQRLWNNPKFKDIYRSHSTYKDNLENLKPEYIAQLEEYKETNPRYYQIYGLGEPGSLEGLIYTNFEIVDMPLKEEYDCFGIDFGMVNPTAIVGIKRYPDKVIRVDELFYRTKYSTTELIDYLKSESELYSNKPMYCDSAEPDRIHELRCAGFNAKQSYKSIKSGIQFVSGFHLEIPAICKNLRREIENYTYKKDRDGNYVDEPLKSLDHTMDAMRYAIHTFLGKKRDITGKKIPVISVNVGRY